MKIVAIFILYFAILLPYKLSAQTNLPSYPDVIKEFFTHYSYQPEEKNDQISFAKKRLGWYVHIVDRLNNDSIKNEQLFRDINENSYRPLNGFGPGLTNEEVMKKVIELLQGDGPFAYGYERCRYFGYNEWAADMIKDFGPNIPANDTLLEGLARAYANYAERFLSYSLGGHQVGDDPLTKKLGNAETANKERINRFMWHLNKAIDCYQVLTQRNPGYMMLVGTPEMKLLNEQFHQYQQLNSYGYTNEAKQLLSTVRNNNIYRQIGYTYLNACPPNSILITFGDNDTYPLWYVQVKEGFRKDVTVLNYSLLGVIPYVNMIKKNKEVILSTTSEFLKTLDFEYFYFYEEPGQPAEISLPLPTFLADIQKIKHPYISSGDTLGTYTTKNISFSIDLARLKKFCGQANLTPVMNFDLNDYMLLNDFIILDILNRNLYTRPICTTAQLELFPKSYQQHEGSVYRILPIADDLPEVRTRMELSRIQRFLTKNYNPVVVSYGKSLNEYQDILRLHATLYAEIINDYIKVKDTTKAKQWASKYLAHPEMKKLSVDFGHMEITEALLNTGYVNNARLLLEKLSAKLVADYLNYSALGYYHSKEDLLQILEYFKSLLDNKTVSSDLLQKAIDDLRN